MDRFVSARSTVDRLSRSRWTIPAIFTLSILLRIFWVVYSHGLVPLLSEMHQVSATLAKTGTIASAYRPDNIPTTHVGPIAAAPAAAVYAILGVDSLPSEIALTVIATAVLFITMILLDRAFALLDVSPLARRAAIALFVLIPVNINMETQDLRVRESGLAAMLLAGLLYAVLRLDRRGQISWRDISGLSALATLLFVLSPSAGVPGYAACGILVIRRIPPRRWIGTAALAAMTLGLASFPWAYRNHELLGRWVWSRGNVGLELAVGTHAAAVSPADPAETFNSRLLEIHPFPSDAAYARMRAAGGELAYADLMGAQTWQWARANPTSAATIWLRHIGEFYFPPTWLWSLTSGRGIVDVLRSVWAAIGTFLAFAALAGFLWNRRWLYFYPLAIAGTAFLPYIVAQPRTRYRYILAGLLIFLACAGVEKVILWISRRRANAEPLPLTGGK